MLVATTGTVKITTITIHFRLIGKFVSVAVGIGISNYFANMYAKINEGKLGVLLQDHSYKIILRYYP